MEINNSTYLLLVGLALAALSWVTSITDLAPTIFICSAFIVRAIEEIK